MAPNLGNVATASPALPVRAPGMYRLGGDASFAARDCVCGHGARSPACEGQFRRSQVSVILAGAFHARSSAGASLLGPGALFLGNAAHAYEFRHVVDGGDRSIVFEYDAAVLDEIAHALALPRPSPFRAAAIPASPAGAGAVALAEQALRSRDPELLREAALAIAAIAVAAERGAPPARPDAHARRVARAVRYIESDLTGDCSLEALAAEAGMSRCHFLRVFRAMTGQTPRQHVIAARLRGAALALRTSRRPITEIAMDVGFGDLSHFIDSFSRAFGVSPRGYRKRAHRSKR